MSSFLYNPYKKKNLHPSYYALVVCSYLAVESRLLFWCFITQWKKMNFKEIKVVFSKTVVFLMDKQTTKQYLDIYTQYILKLKQLTKEYGVQLRMPNFPEGISENLVKFFIQDFEKRPCRNGSCGDLESDHKRIEVKCFTSNGPTSFGPTETWHELYFVDARTIVEDGGVKIYKCAVANHSSIWQNLKMNKNETFGDKCKKGQRPRIHFFQLQTMLDTIQLVFDAHVDVLFDNKSEMSKENENQQKGSEDMVPEISICLSSKKPRLADFCAGSGAFSYVFHHLQLSDVVFANDCEKSCQIFYETNLPGHKLQLADIFDLRKEDIAPMDILTAGFPCQPFSIAGKQEGFRDERSNVFHKLMEILEFHRPRFVILENVKNLQSHDKKNTFRTILNRFDTLGYFLKYKVINTCTFSPIPQNRERLYMVGFREKIDYDGFTFPKEEGISRLPLVSFLESEVADKYYYTPKTKIYPTLVEQVKKMIDENVLYQYRRFYVRENKHHVCPTLTANMGGGGHNVPILRDHQGIRKLTPRECFRLQGFPDSIQLPSTLSDTALYKIAGNAVSIPVVKKIALCLLKKCSATN